MPKRNALDEGALSGTTSYSVCARREADRKRRERSKPHLPPSREANHLLFDNLTI
jgi:hypothetical protein